MMLKDSGNRKLWNTGAVRDRQHGKGRMDLMSFDVMSTVYEKMHWDKHIVDIFMEFYNFQRDANSERLYNILINFCEYQNERYELTTPMLMLEVSKQAEDGADKYADRNWELGMPVSRFIDSAARHLTQYLAGMTDEPHARAFMWNIMSAIWTINNNPSQLDYPIDYEIVKEQVASKAKELKE